MWAGQLTNEHCTHGYHPPVCHVPPTSASGEKPRSKTQFRIPPTRQEGGGCLGTGLFADLSPAEGRKEERAPTWRERESWGFLLPRTGVQASKQASKQETERGQNKSQKNRYEYSRPSRQIPQGRDIQPRACTRARGRWLDRCRLRRERQRERGQKERERGIRAGLQQLVPMVPSRPSL